MFVLFVCVFVFCLVVGCLAWFVGWLLGLACFVWFGRCGVAVGLWLFGLWCCVFGVDLAALFYSVCGWCLAVSRDMQATARKDRVMHGPSLCFSSYDLI